MAAEGGQTDPGLHRFRQPQFPGQQHRQKSFQAVPQQGQDTNLSANGAIQVGGADIAAAFLPDINAVQFAQQKAGGDGAQQVGSGYPEQSGHGLRAKRLRASFKYLLDGYSRTRRVRAVRILSSCFVSRYDLPR